MPQSQYFSISLVVPLTLLSRKPHFLGSYRSPSVNVNTSIPEDRPRVPCILVSSTSFMSSLDHLKWAISAFWVGCVSRALLQLHHHTVEIRTRYWSVHYFFKDISCHLTLAHWWVYYGTHIVSCPLLFPRFVGNSVQNPLSIMLPCISSSWCCILYHKYSVSHSLSPYTCVHPQI